MRGWRVAVVAILGLAASCASGPEVPRPEFGETEAEIVEAVDRARELVRDDPESAEAWGRLGDRLFAHEWWAEAAECYGAAERLEPDRFLWPYLHGLSSMEQGAFAEASEAIARAIEIDGRYPPALINQAGLVVRLGRSEEARPLFLLAARLDPTSSHAKLGLGQIDLDAGRYEEAIRHLREASLRDPMHGEVHQALAQAYLATGQEEAAREHAALTRDLPKTTPMRDPRALLSIEPAGANAHFLLGERLLREKALREGEHELRLALQANPEHRAAHLALGRHLAATGRGDEAAAHLREALRLKASDLDALESLAMLLTRLGRFDEALPWLESAVDQRPDRADLRIDLGLVLHRTGDAERAAAELREAVRLRPDDARTHLGLAEVLSGNATEESIACLRRSLELRPDWARPAQRLAWIRATAAEARHRDGAEAIRLAEQAADASDASFLPEVLDALAAGYAEAGRYDEAVATLERAVDASRASGRTDLTVGLEARRASYVDGRPWRGGP